MIKHIRKTLYLFVLIGYSFAVAGSYEDFFQAVQRDDADDVSSLLRRGFDPNTLDPQLRQALFIALTEPSPRVLEVLLKWPATKFDQRNPHDETPLMLAALKGNLGTVKALIARDADVNKTGWAPLHYAATNGHVEVMKLLLEQHAYIDAASPSGNTPLMMAALYGTPEAVKLLLDEGADPNLKNEQQLSASDFARRGSREESAALIDAASRRTRSAGKP